MNGEPEREPHPDLAGLKEPGAVVARRDTCDILIYDGEITVEHCARLIRLIPPRAERAANVLLVLSTPGGDPDAAFRLARGLQIRYQKFTILVFGACKSAGTLAVAGAHAIIMDDDGELGPLDVQLLKPDEFFERTSGLAVEAAMDFLDARAIGMFNMFLSEILIKFPELSVKTASGHAATLVAELLGRIYSQFDPIKIGETQRSVRVADYYCKQLNVQSKNFLGDEGIETLISLFPSHTAVIDRDMARLIFKNVDKPLDYMASFTEALKAIEPAFEATTLLACLRLDGEDLKVISA